MSYKRSQPLIGTVIVCERGQPNDAVDTKSRIITLKLTQIMPK